jgi:hypothetical protein
MALENEFDHFLVGDDDSSVRESTRRMGYLGKAESCLSSSEVFCNFQLRTRGLYVLVNSIESRR